MNKSELKQLIREEIQKVLNKKLSFLDLYNTAKSKYGRKVEGDERAFEFPSKNGTIDMYPTQDGRVEVTWWVGGDSTDTDYYSMEDAYNMI